MSTTSDAPRVRLDGIGKRYAGTAVLDGVSLEFAGGRVHGLVGENGAGKSTLLRVLCGLTAADSGRVLVDGRPVPLRGPRDALAHGVALVSQEAALVPAMSVLDNVFLGRWAGARGLRDRRADRARFAALVRRTGIALDPDARAGDLSAAGRQWAQLLRALAREPRVVALDEPTASLTRAEAARVLDLVRSLARGGAAVVLVSHLLDQVLGTCDEVSVLRDGRRVLTAPAAGQTPRSLVRHMAGRPVEVRYPEPEPVPVDAPVALSVRGLARAGVVRGVDLDVRAGEIAGLVGLGGARSAVLRLIAGADRRDGGAITVGGRPLRRPSPARAAALGLVHVPRSREEEGLVLARPTGENLALATLADRRRAGFVRRGAEARDVRAMAARLDLRGADPRGPALHLSGGNQQKALFGKWLLREPRVLLVDEPTRGVDVAAKARIHRLLVELAAAGRAVLLVSAEIDEVLGLSHRVHVLHGGRIAGTFERGASREDVLALAFGDPED